MDTSVASRVCSTEILSSCPAARTTPYGLWYYLFTCTRHRHRVSPGPWKSLKRLNLKGANSRPWKYLKMKVVLEKSLKMICCFWKIFIDWKSYCTFRHVTVNFGNNTTVDGIFCYSAKVRVMILLIVKMTACRLAVTWLWNIFRKCMVGNGCRRKALEKSLRRFLKVLEFQSHKSRGILLSCFYPRYIPRGVRLK